jgi:hypothetical protein
VKVPLCKLHNMADYTMDREGLRSEMLQAPTKARGRMPYQAPHNLKVPLGTVGESSDGRSPPRRILTSGCTLQTERIAPSAGPRVRAGPVRSGAALLCIQMRTCVGPSFLRQRRTASPRGKGLTPSSRNPRP